ncbi:MAG: flagellin lysine-N-methylase [Marinobacterium sp.]|nr:flagellin lysine-N-methylase [Marinobacterium sp.]
MTKRYSFELLSSYEHFKCIGGECEFTCCGSWNINIDQRTHDTYVESDQTQGTHIMDNIITSDTGGSTIRLNQSGHCPMVRQDGLCSLVCDFGESYLSDACTLYPRIRLDYEQSATSAISLSISCPEAARLTVFNPTPVGIITEFDERHAALNIPMLSDRYEGLNSDHETVLNIISKNLTELVQLRTVPLRKRLTTLIFLVSQAKEYNLATSTEFCIAFNNEVANLINNNLTSIPDVPADPKNQFDVLTRLTRITLKAIENQPSRDYPLDRKVRNIITQSMQGLGMNDMEHPEKTHFQHYLQAGQTLVAPYLEANPHILENLISYHLLKGNLLFPDNQSRMQPMLLIMLYLLLIVGLANGYARYHGGMDDEKMNELIYSFHRFMEHSPGTQEFMADVCEKLAATTPEQLYSFFGQ